MISKKLLSKVLELEIIDYHINENQVRINQLWHEDTPLNRELELINTSYGCEVSINIYELAYKCKEWAWELRYDLQVKRHEDVSFCCKIDEKNVKYHPAKWADSEPEAIFKACQWILDNREG